MEYSYKLNLPELTEIIKDSAKEKIFIGGAKSIHKSFSAIDMLNQEWLTFKNIPWTQFVMFYKPDYLGAIHIDDTQPRAVNEECIWGINFIYGGSGTLEFWEPEDMRSMVYIKDAVGTYNMQCVTDTPARKIYTQTPGAYIVNASTIHRAKGIGNRYSFSLRPSGSAGFTWEKLINHFSDLIMVSPEGIEPSFVG